MSDRGMSCDEHCTNRGCNQGRDCPARKKRIEHAKRLLDEADDIRLGWGDLALVIGCVLLVLAIVHSMAGVLL